MMLKPAAVFSSNMVLQQGVPDPVWGRAAPGVEVTCRLDPAGVSAAAVAGADGSWRLELPPAARRRPLRHDPLLRRRDPAL